MRNSTPILLILLLTACPRSATEPDVAAPHTTSSVASPTVPPEPTPMKVPFVPWSASVNVAVSGAARDAKGGAVLLVGPGQVPLYLEGLDAWPEARLNTTQHAHGRVVAKHKLAEAGQDADGAWSQGVEPGGGPQWVLEAAAIVDRPLAPAAFPAAFTRAAWPERAPCLDAIGHALGKTGLDDFLVGAELQQQDGKTAFALWHRTAFAPEHEGMVGNPGGLSRNALCDQATGTFDRFLFWQ